MPLSRKTSGWIIRVLWRRKLGQRSASVFESSKTEKLLNCLALLTEVHSYLLPVLQLHQQTVRGWNTRPWPPLRADSWPSRGRGLRYGVQNWSPSCRHTDTANKLPAFDAKCSDVSSRENSCYWNSNAANIQKFHYHTISMKSFGDIGLETNSYL